MIWKLKKLSVVSCCFALLLSVGLSTLLTKDAQAQATANAKINSVWQSVGFRTRTGTVWNNYGNVACRSYTEQNGAWFNGLQMNYTLGKYVSNTMIFEQQFYFYNGTKDNSLDSYVKIGYMSSPFELISSEYQQLSAGAGLWTLYFRINSTENVLNGYYHLFPEGTDLFRLFPDECINSGSLTIWETWNVNNTADILNAINQQKSYLENISGEATSIAGHAWEINNSTKSIVQKLNELENKSAVDAQNNEINQTEQTQTESQTSADSSQQQAQQGGSTLLQGFSAFVGALTSASASNCVINGDIGDFKMGNMDLCQLNPPPAFQAISSIMVIGFVVPLSIATIRKFIGMFRSFQNG